MKHIYSCAKAQVFGKVFLVVALLMGTGGKSWGQLTLGTSPYTQNFDGVGTALPAGWSVYTGASSSSLGSVATFNTNTQSWASGAGNFANFASTTSTVANGGILLTSTSTTGNQSSSTNRALGIQQTGAFGDPGASASLRLNNTTGLTSFSLNFSLQQGASTAGRTTGWRVDYGFGTTPTAFTTATTSPASISTAAGTFGSTTVTVNFGSALDNSSQNVWIRIWAPAVATGGGNRPATGIDDYQLSWSSAATLTPPTLTAAPSATVDAPFDVIFTDDASWRAAINLTTSTIGGSTFTAGAATSSGKITFTPSASAPAALLQTAATRTIVIKATGYSDATVSQVIGAGAPSKLAVVTALAAPASNGAVLATQPAVGIRDQYNNATTSTATINAAVGAGTWTLGGATGVAAVAGTTTFTNLTATSAGAVTGATIAFTSSGLTGVTSAAFNIPAPAPANDNCSGAINLTVSASAVSGSFAGSTPMTGSTYNDVFYMFTPTYPGIHIVTINNFSAASDKDLFVYSVCPPTYSTTTNVVGSGVTSSTTNETATTSALTTSTSYKVLVKDYGGAGGTFDISVIGPGPALTAAPAATVDAPFDITFTDDAAWRAAINLTTSTIGGSTFTGGVTLSAGKLTFTPSASNPATLLQTATTRSIVIKATGYTDVTVSQVINPGVPAALTIGTQPTAPVASGGTLAAQPTVNVRDQYTNLVGSGITVNAAVTAGQTSSWSLGGTLGVSTNASGLATFAGLTATNLTSSAYAGASITFTPTTGAGTVTSNTFTVPLPAGPALTGVAATVDAPFTITFTSSPSWTGAITGITVGGTALSNTAYSITATSITFTPSASALLQVAGTYTIIVSATGYNNDSFSQTINPGIPASVAVSTQPTAPSSNGGALATQPRVTVSDQYNNPVLAGVTVNAVVTAGQTSSWTLGGTATATTNASGVAVFSGLTASNLTASAYTLATLTFTPATGAGTTTSSPAFTIPAGTLTTDYFQSNTASGTWSTAGSWQSSHTGSAPWITATIAPTTAAANAITILAGNQINLASTITIDQLTVAGTLEIQTGGIININNGTGDDITINGGGIIRSLATKTYNAEINPSGAANIHVLAGGKYTLGTGTGGSSSDYLDLLANANNIWETDAVFESNVTNAYASSAISNIFPSAATTVPIFRVIAANGFGSSTDLTFNGLVEVNANLSLSSTGDKTFRNGIKGTATLTQGGTGSFILNGTNEILDGASLRIALASPLILSKPVTVPLNAVVTISGGNINNNTSGNNLIINGTLDIGTVSITNGSATVTVNGKIRTANTTGFTGSGSIPAGTVTLNNTSSTVEYYASANQVVTSRSDYYNITLSGTGTKTISSGFNPAGTVYVTASAILETAAFGFGNAVTNLTMDGGRFRMSGTGTKPDIDGTYNLTGGVIEFYNVAGTRQTIKPKNAASADIIYNQIEVTGSNVGQSNADIVLNDAGGKFTVNGTVSVPATFYMSSKSIKSNTSTNTASVNVGQYGTFNTSSSMGFSGFTTTFTDNSSVSSNISSIVLAAGSTVDYSGTGAQAISNQVAYQNLTLSSATGTKTAPSGILSVKGNFAKTGVAAFANNGGTVTLDGTTATTQTFTAVDSLDFYKLTNNNTNGGLTVNGHFGIENLLTLTSGSKTIFGTSDISIRSKSNFTAAIGNSTGAIITYLGAGRFIVEKYILTPRKWQFLSSEATKGSQSFLTSWMENQSPVANGYGMWVTGLGGAPNFDFATSTPTIKWWNGTNINASYTGISAKGDDIHAQPAYMTYVRGDRGSTGANPGTLVPTILRTKGQINIGSYPASAVSVNATDGFVAVGNPYASAVDLRTMNINLPTSDLTFLVWDPKLTGDNGLGGFQYITGKQSTGFTVSPGGGSYPTTPVGAIPANMIESGQAFFAQTPGTTLTLQFTEASKGTYQNTVSFTPGDAQFLAGRLNINDGTQNVVMDGFTVKFDNGYSNEANYSDAHKMQNTNENISVKTQNTLLAVELRRPVDEYDTVHINMANMRVKDYNWTFNMINMDQPGRLAFLVDQYNHSTTSLDLVNENNYNFSVTADAASAAADRFLIVFKPGAVLPVSFTSITAKREKDLSATVKFATATEINIHHYEVERSYDGLNFTTIGTVAATNNTGGSAAYTYVDARPATTAVYYHIEAVSNNGQVQRSRTVKLDPLSGATEIVVSPNPVKDKTIHLQMNNQPAGDYTMQLINTAGQTIFKTTITINTNAETLSIGLPKNIPPGTYSILLQRAGGNAQVQQIIIL